ncbi:MAG: ABC transporter substrate-binding protein [Ilumatobacter sp.]
MSFSLIAAACGGNDDGTTSSDDDTEAEAPSGDDADGGDDADDGGDADDGADDQGEAEEEVADVDAGVQEEVVEADEEEAGPTQGGTLRYGLEADVDGINPASSSLSAPGLTMANAVFDTLTAATTDGEFVPYLAESVEPVDDTFATWQVTLREGITFHDGTPLNAEAVQINFETQRADPLVGLAVAPFFPAEGASEIIDDLTIQYNLLEGNRYFAGNLSTQLGYVASPTWLAAALEDPTLNQQPVGTGPFVFEQRSEDSVTTFVRNDAWWNGEVYLDSVEFAPVTDPDNRTDLLLEGDLNALHTTNPPSVQIMRDEEGIQNVVDESGEESFAMINTGVPPFNDIRAREALARATPLENYRTLIGVGVSTAANQRYTPGSRFYNPDVVQVGDDPDGALALVADYCASNGADENPILGGAACTDGRINIELQWSGPAVVQTRIAEILDEGWSAGGFNVTFNELPQDAHIQETALGQYNVNTWRQFGATDPSSDNVWLLCRSIGFISLNWPKNCNEAKDALMLEGQLIENGPERDALYQQLEQITNDEYLYIYFLHTIWDNAFGPDVRGVCDRTAPGGEELICSTNGRTWFDTVYIVE